MQRNTMTVILAFASIQAITMAGQNPPLFKTGAQIERQVVRKNPEDSLVGKQLWFVPNILMENGRLGFARRPEFEYQTQDRKLFPESIVSLKVLRRFSEDSDHDYYEVLFSNDTVGYITSRIFSDRISYLSLEDIHEGYDRNSINSKVQILTNPQKFTHEMFFTVDPSLLIEKKKSIDALMAKTDIIEAEKARKAEVRNKLAAVKAREKATQDEAAWKARGGVRVGMTKAQVLASNWGKPVRVNTTVLPNNSVHEQWVYSLSHFLYFEDGVLVTIQKSE